MQGKVPEARATVRLPRAVAALALAPILLVACRKEPAIAPAVYADNPEEKTIPVYVVSSHPHVSEQRMFELFAPLVDWLNREVKGARFRLETVPDYPTYERRLYDRQYHFSIPNPLHTLESLKHGYLVVGKVADDSQFTGLVLARKDHVPAKVADLKGKKVAYPAATAVAACMMPQLFFTEQGLDVNRDIENIFTGNQESSINAVATGITDVAVTWPPPWNVYQRTRPESADKLQVVWRTPPLVNNGLVVRDDVPKAVREQVVSILFGLSKDARGRKILSDMAYAGFEPATRETYAPVAEFLEQFAKRVRPIRALP